VIFLKRFAALMLCALAHAVHAYEVEEPWQEAETILPPPPNMADLIEVDGGPANPNRFFVDSKNLSPGPDGVMRYTLVVVTPSGVRNVTFEGLRCKTGEKRIYAVGRADGSWAESPASRWQAVRASAYHQIHPTLLREGFCDLVVMHSDLRLVRANLSKSRPN
jgi:hypothetical protein